MAKTTGFLDYSCELPPIVKPEERVKHSREFIQLFNVDKLHNQAARCMDCGVPFCHNGCPLGNIIPEFNDAVYQEKWLDAYNILSATNNFPEFTGRICPAPCESACVLGINQPPVLIESIEKQIIEIAFQNGYVKPNIPRQLNEHAVAIIGSGPAGLAAASELNKLGYSVTIFEKNASGGGLLRYGIPDFKLEKWVIDRRLDLMQQEGINFKYKTCVGVDVSVDDLLRDYAAVVFCGGVEEPRDLMVPGRQLNGVHFAMEYLVQQNKRIACESDDSVPILATDKNVVIIGSGDTGSDCIGTANRQGALTITQLAQSPMPPSTRTSNMPWPTVPKLYTTSSSQEEGCTRLWGVGTKEFIGDAAGNLVGIVVADIVWDYSDLKKPKYFEKPGSERILPCELALIAVGFGNPVYRGMLEDSGVELDQCGNVLAAGKSYQTSIPKIFASGDMRRGQSLVVWAIHEGRECALSVHQFLSTPR